MARCADKADVQAGQKISVIIKRKEEVNEEILKSIASCHPDGTPRYRWIGDKEQLVEHFKQLAGRITRS